MHLCFPFSSQLGRQYIISLFFGKDRIFWPCIWSVFVLFCFVLVCILSGLFLYLSVFALCLFCFCFVCFRFWSVLGLFWPRFGMLLHGSYCFSCSTFQFRVFSIHSWPVLNAYEIAFKEFAVENFADNFQEKIVKNLIFLHYAQSQKWSLLQIAEKYS